MTFQAGGELGGSNKEVKSLSTTRLQAFPWRSVTDFIDGCGNNRIDVVRITLQKPQHGRSGRAIFTALNDRDGTGPRALVWRFKRADGDGEVVTNIFEATIHQLVHPFM